MQKIKYWLPAIIIMTLIFLGSNDPASGEKSDFITRFIWKIIYTITGHLATPVEEGSTTFVIRKIAHVSEYTFLTISYFYALAKTYFKETDFYKIYAFSFLFGVLYACSDEFHQSFIPGRVGTYEDVLIDSMGVLLSLFILPFIYKRIKRNS